ncbi:hypothetical protein A3J90_07200 [candidate division WOR-1 bacterium RIFOXYC2_FULL_37_10]|uniref:Uncharacterized protein n=1 Tax=candidate division WOR-1 bacterium RIFOXYB2_FULL_37_13 TaxID=1802579 RepID=A0A1F4SWY2_UNCSA|nr:MAG: hypothetical protein A2246_01215 [candidate division WOR-1 bacterium RIFOXYA2_FULL_37_7]OGC24954.1 MAG: hypothetical protein A2310_03645 [candidate division WOR-1 bacterium RIFOXYB2_FULL_37_13]OGC32401.1 MAG: hypothetical protein A3J90_07200 [candidate division WOR-1 bacterium RIFOXYC2_FULL_37_10]
MLNPIPAANRYFLKSLKFQLSGFFMPRKDVDLLKGQLSDILRAFRKLQTDLSPKSIEKTIACDGEKRALLGQLRPKLEKLNPKIFKSLPLTDCATLFIILDKMSQYYYAVMLVDSMRDNLNSLEGEVNRIFLKYYLNGYAKYLPDNGRSLDLIRNQIDRFLENKKSGTDAGALYSMFAALPIHEKIYFLKTASSRQRELMVDAMRKPKKQLNAMRLENPLLFDKSDAVY